MQANFVPIDPAAGPAAAGAARPRARRAALALLVTALCALGAEPARALQSDSAQPLHAAADSMHYDDVKQALMFTGNPVVLTKGSLRITADRVEVVQTPDGYDMATAFGTAAHPATYEQTLDAPPGAPTSVTRGRGLQLHYDGRLDVVTFTGQAALERFKDGKLSDRAQGSVITYEDLTDRFAVTGGKNGATADNPHGRVRVMLSPRGSKPAAPASGATLRLTPKVDERP